MLVSVSFMLLASFLISDETADPESSIISKVLPASSPVRVEALDLTTDTVTILSLLGPTSKRGACGLMPLCSFPANNFFNMAILTTSVAALIIITPAFRAIPLKVSYLITVEATPKVCCQSLLRHR